MEGTPEKCLDDSVMDTPVPQATSTVGRMQHYQECVVDDDSLSEPAGLLQSLHPSCVSSLGILRLDSLPDFQELPDDVAQELDKLSVPPVFPRVSSEDLAADLRLRMQKVLAESTMELSNADVCALPSYLLKPDDNSDFEADDTGESEHCKNLGNVQTTRQDLLSTFDGDRKYFGGLSNSYLKNTSDTITEQFDSSEAAAEKLMRDEQEWAENAVPPILGTPSTQDVSSFSARSDHHDFVLDSSSDGADIGKRVSIRSYFARRCYNPGNLVSGDLYDGADGGSEECMSSAGLKQNVAAPHSGGPKYNTSYNPPLSITRIADLLAKADNCLSPRSLVDNILKHVQKTPRMDSYHNLSGSRQSPADSNAISQARQKAQHIAVSETISSENSCSKADDFMSSCVDCVSFITDGNEFSEDNLTVTWSPTDCDSVASANSAVEDVNSSMRRATKSVDQNVAVVEPMVKNSVSELDTKVVASSKSEVSSKSNSVHTLKSQVGYSEEAPQQSPISKPGVQVADMNCITAQVSPDPAGSVGVLSMEDSLAKGDLSVLWDLNLDSPLNGIARSLAELPENTLDCSALAAVVKPEGSSTRQSRQPRKDAHWKRRLETTHESFTSSIISSPKGSSWVELLLPSEGFSVYVGVPGHVSLPVRNSTNRWLLCGVGVEEVTVAGGPQRGKDVAQVLLPSERVLLVPHDMKEAKVVVDARLAGMLTVSVHFCLLDVVTKVVQKSLCDLTLVAEFPSVSKSPRVLDFGIIPERNCCELKVSLHNKGVREVPIKAAIRKGTGDWKSFSCSQTEPVKLPPGGSFSLPVTMSSYNLPRLNKQHTVTSLSADLLITAGTSDIVLEKVELMGKVGFTLLEMKADTPFIVFPGVCRPLLLRNSGVVDLNLEFSVENLLQKDDEANDVITVAPRQLNLAPGKADNIGIKFIPQQIGDKPVKRMLFIQVLPSGPLQQILLQGMAEEPGSAPVKHVKESQEASEVPLSRSRASSHSSQDSASRSSLPTSRGSSNSSSRLPLETTHTELVWGSVAVGHSESLSCTLRNSGPQPYKMQVWTDGDGYRLLDERGVTVPKRTLLLHPGESHAMSVSFSPTHTGASPGKVRFELAGGGIDRQVIHLLGYGGHARTTVRGVTKDPAGRMWLDLGAAGEECGVLESSLTLHNGGTLPAFFHARPVWRGLQKLTVKVLPTRGVLGPGQSTNVTVSYQPRREDFLTRSGCEVCEVAAVAVLVGDEPSRHRLRRVNRSLGSQVQQKPLVPLAHSELQELCLQFPDEISIPDISKLKDSQSSVRPLLATFKTHEIALTVELATDQTLNLCNNMSRVFRPLCENSTLTATRLGPEVDSDHGVKWQVHPSSLVLVPGHRSEAVFSFTNISNAQQPFEVVSEGGVLLLEPTAGMLAPQGLQQVHVRCVTWPQSQWVGAVCVYLEHDMLEVRVTILPAPSPPLRLDTPIANFPDTPVGKSCRFKLGLTNTSASSVRVQLIGQLGDSPFDCHMRSFVLQPKMYVHLRLYFTPTAAEEYEQTLTLVSNFGPPVKVTLAGKGVSQS